MIKRDCPIDCAMDPAVPQAMSPTSRETLRDPCCERESVGTALRIASRILIPGDETVAKSQALSGCGVWEALGTAREDSQQSTSTDRGLVNEIVLEQDIGDTRETSSARPVRQSVVVITDSLRRQEATDLLGGLTTVVGDWGIGEDIAYAFLGDHLEEGFLRQTGDSPSQDSLKLLDVAAANGVEVVRSDCIEMDQRKDLSWMTDALERLVPTGVCVVQGIMTAGQVDLVIANVIETEVDAGSVAHVVQCGRSGVHSSGKDVERRSGGVVACEVGACQTGGERSRPPKEDFFILRDPTLPSKVRALSSPPSSSVPNKVSSQLDQGMCVVEQPDGSPSKIRSPKSLEFMDPDDVSGACFSMGKASPMLCNGQGKDGVSTGLSSFRSGMNCQGPAAHIESVDRTSVIADLPSMAICEHWGKAALRDVGKFGYSPVFQDLKRGEGVIGDQSKGLERVGVKTSKKAIPSETPVPQHAGCGAVSTEAAEFPSSQPIGFRPGSAEPVVTSQPIGFRPGIAEPVVTSQPIGFKPGIAEPVVTSQPVGFRPDLSASAVVSQHMGSRTEAEVPVPVASCIGFRRLEPSFGEQGVGFAIHVELRESASGESLRKGCMGDASQSHMVSDRGNAADLSPGTLGERKPRLHPDQWQVVEPCKRSNGNMLGVVSHKDNGIGLLQQDCDHLRGCQDESHRWDSTRVLYEVVGSNILSAAPTTEYSVRSCVHNEGLIIRSAAIRSLPSSGTGASSEGSKQELCGISEEGEGTTPSTRAVAPPQSTVAHGPQLDQPLRGSVPLFWGMPTSASSDGMHVQPDRRRALLRPRFALPSWVEQATTKVSQDLSKMLSKGKVAEQNVCVARSVPGYVSRPDALPSWVCEQCPSSAQRPAQESCVPDKVAGMSGQPLKEKDNPAAMDQIPWSTWFSKEHVCGSQCFPPCNSKKVQPRRAGEFSLESFSESSLSNDSVMEALSLDYADWPEPASDLWSEGRASYAAVSLHPSVAISPGMVQLPELGVAPQMPRVESLDACTNAGSCAAVRACAFDETKGVENRGVSPDPDHKPMGFSPDYSQVQSFPCDNACIDPNLKPLGFSPDSPQVQGSLHGTAQTGLNHKLPGVSVHIPQVAPPISDQVIAPGVAGLHVPGAVSNRTVVQDVPEPHGSRVLGLIGNQLASQAVGTISISSGVPQVYQIHDDDSDHEQIDFDPWWDTMWPPLTTTMPLPRQALLGNMSLPSSRASARLMDCCIYSRQITGHAVAAALPPGTVSFTIQTLVGGQALSSAPSEPGGVRIVGAEGPPPLSLELIGSYARHVNGNVLRWGESPCLGIASKIESLCLCPGESATSSVQLLTLLASRRCARHVGGSGWGVEGSKEGMLEAADAQTVRIGTVVEASYALGVRPQHDPREAIPDPLRMQHYLSPSVPESGAEAQKGQTPNPVGLSSPPDLCFATPNLAGLSYLSHESYVGLGDAKECQGAVVKVVEADSKEQMHIDGIRYCHPNPRSRGFSPASPRVVRASAIVTGRGVRASIAVLGQVRSQPIGQAGDVHLSQQAHSQPIGQAGDVHLSQQAHSQPIGQAGDVHLSQQAHSQPIGQAGDVHLSQQAHRQPEGQAGDVHLSQQARSHPEVQAGEVHLSQQACSQPEVQAKEAHPSRRVYSNQLDGQVRDVHLSQGASGVSAQAGQAQSGQEDLGRGVEDGRARAERTALSGGQVQGIRVPEHSTAKPVRFSPFSGVRLGVTDGIVYPLGYQQAAGEAARAWRVTGYPYYTQVGVRSSRPLPPKHRRLGFSPQHDPRGAVQDPVGFDPQRDLCENVPNHFRTCLSSPGAIPGKTLTAVPQVSGAVSSAMPQVSGAVSSAMPQVSGAVSSAMPQVSGAVSGAMPQVSGAVLRAMPRDSDAILDVESKALGAHQDEASHRCSVQGPTGRSIAHKDLVSRPDSRVNPGESSLLSSVRPRQGNSVGQVTKMRCNPNPVGYRPLTPNEWLGDTNQISSPCHSDLRFGPTSPIRRSPSMSSGVAVLLSQNKKEQDNLGQIPSVSRNCTTRPGSSVCIQHGAQVSEMPSGSATCVQQGTWVSDVPASGYECAQLGGQVNQVPLGLSAL